MYYKTIQIELSSKDELTNELINQIRDDIFLMMTNKKYSGHGSVDVVIKEV